MSKTPKLRFKEFSGDWEVKKLGNICEVTMGQSPSSSCYNEENIGLPLIQGNADVKDRKTAPRIYTSDITKTCDVGDIIMSVRAPVGAISKSIHNACIGRGVCSIKPKQNNEFIYQILLKYEDKWGRISQGSTFESVNRTDITETKVTIPSIEEQEKIASFFSLIDDKISLQGEKVEALKDYKSGMMQKIFSRELRFKDDEGRDYPEWEEKKLGDICTFFSGGTPLTTNSKYYNGDIPFIRSAEISSDKTELTISEEGLKNSSAKMVKKGDLLYALYGATSGEVSVSKIDGAINQAVLCIKSDNVNLSFMEQILRKNKNRIINTYLQGGQGNLSANIIKGLRYLLPNIEEQNKIASFFNNLDNKIEKEQEKLDSLNEYKKGLLQQMFI